jgi:hypothetical protein
MVASLCSAANAQDRLAPSRASATYWTATNTLEISMTFTRLVNLEEDNIQFIGWSPAGQWPPDDGLLINNNRTDTFSMNHVTFLSPGTELRDLGSPTYEITGTTFEFTIPFDLTEFDTPIFDFQAAADGPPRNSGPIRGVSSVDSVVVYVPEPSSIAIASMSALACLVYRIRRGHFSPRR